MNETDHLWELERGFWLKGADHYRLALDPSCVMVFPMGAVQGEAILAAVQAAPRWALVQMAERQTGRPSNDLAVLAYRATGHREGPAPYEAWCSSTYRRDGPRWRLIQHQQTPIAL